MSSLGASSIAFGEIYLDSTAIEVGPVILEKTLRYPGKNTLKFAVSLFLYCDLESIRSKYSLQSPLRVKVTLSKVVETFIFSNLPILAIFMESFLGEL